MTGFIIGLFVGGGFGVFIMCLMNLASRCDEEINSRCDEEINSGDRISSQKGEKE